MEPVAALVLNAWKKQSCTPVPCSSLAKSPLSALGVTEKRGGWTMFQAKDILNQPTSYLHGANTAGALEQLCLGGKGQCLERGIEIGRDFPDQLPFVLPSVLRAVPREGGGMAGGAVVWEPPLFRQLHMAHAHLLNAETFVPLSTPSFPS